MKENTSALVNMLQKKVYTESGQFTRAYEEYISIKQLIYEACKKEINYDQWHNLTISKDNASNVSKHLINCIDTEFEDLKPDRHVFSFKNGIYITSTDTNTFHIKNQVAWILISFRVTTLICISQKMNMKMKRGLIFLRHTHHSLWMIRKFENDVQKVLWVMIGRCFYEVNELDGWQVVPFL